MNLPPAIKSYANVTVQEGKAIQENKEEEPTPWLYDEGYTQPAFTAEIREYSMAVVKKVYPTASSTLGSRLQHWAIVLKPLDTAEEILLEFSPSGVVMNVDGESAHEVFLEDGEAPTCTELGKTAKSLEEIKVWIFDKYKVYRDDNFEGFGRQSSDVQTYNVVSNNCQNFAMCLCDYLRTRINTHSQATEVIGSIGAVGGLALAGFHAPVVAGAGAVLAGAAALGAFEHVTENVGIAQIGDGIQGVVNGVDVAFCGAPRYMVKSTMNLAVTGAGAAMAVTNIARQGPPIQAGASADAGGQSPRGRLPNQVRHSRLAGLDSFYKHDPLTAADKQGG